MKMITRKLLFIIFTLCFLFELSSIQAQDYENTVITDPSISRRCEELLDKRNQKVAHKQKLMELITRNRKLLKYVPKEKKTVKVKLIENYGKLKNELRLSLIKITHLEESIVRTGCPGLTL
ncbi:hypothetical protein [Halobacteriovorax sp. JY17]|uniref:hypothetical protein n=1 Tax=Halobacteriovorax sp. JY17 TaxID=2014617 RepID=UPI000C49F829|nr:hypothetical protein [Halobacteriovorax sp. JY17]PIK16689.1 MAG: hypothetical protein CES88_08065 [Halobacteriovorax sp. JY17]